MTRTEKLARYLADSFQRAYLVGHWDCIVFVSMWADLMEGGHSCPPDRPSHTGTIRDTYTSEDFGRERWAPESINAAISSHLKAAGWEVVERPAQGQPWPFQLGDIVLTNLQHPGIWDGEKIIAQPANAAGVLHIHPRHAHGGFRFLRGAASL